MQNTVFSKKLPENNPNLFVYLNISTWSFLGLNLICATGTRDDDATLVLIDEPLETQGVLLDLPRPMERRSTPLMTLHVAVRGAFAFGVAVHRERTNAVGGVFVEAAGW